MPWNSGRRPLGPLSVIVLVLVALQATPAHAQWKWRDKEGHLTVSDRPPPRDVPDADILARPEARRVVAPPPAASTASGALPLAPRETPLENEIEAKRRSLEQERAAKAKAEEERNAIARAENCRRARGQQAALESGQRIARVNAAGEREILDDKGRADELRMAREVIASDCR